MIDTQTIQSKLCKNIYIICIAINIYILKQLKKKY